MARAVGDTSLFWGASPTAITWASSGPDGVTNGNFSGLSNEIDLSSVDNVEDVLISCKSKTGAGSLANGFSTQVYAAAPGDGTNYPAHNGSYHPVGPPHRINAANTTEYSNQFSLAAAFGGILPRKFKVAMFNNSGLTLAGTSGQATENLVYYQLVYRNSKLS